MKCVLEKLTKIVDTIKCKVENELKKKNFEKWGQTRIKFGLDRLTLNRVATIYSYEKCNKVGNLMNEEGGLTK